jgi:hypothetical protein
MPFIARVVEEHTGPGNGVIRTPYRGHVPEDELRPTDQLVEPTADELERLRAQWPEEYDTPGVSDETFVFPEANAADAIAAIEAMGETPEHLEQLAEWFEYELAHGKRKTVLAAFAEKGLTEE